MTTAKQLNLRTALLKEWSSSLNLAKILHPGATIVGR